MGNGRVGGVGQRIVRRDADRAKQRFEQARDPALLALPSLGALFWAWRLTHQDRGRQPGTGASLVAGGNGNRFPLFARDKERPACCFSGRARERCSRAGCVRGYSPNPCKLAARRRELQHRRALSECRFSSLAEPTSWAVFLRSKIQRQFVRQRAGETDHHRVVRILLGSGQHAVAMVRAYHQDGCLAGGARPSPSTGRGWRAGWSPAPRESTFRLEPGSGGPRAQARW